MFINYLPYAVFFVGIALIYIWIYGKDNGKF
jgi:hypothetical protein